MKCNTDDFPMMTLLFLCTLFGVVGCAHSEPIDPYDILRRAYSLEGALDSIPFCSTYYIEGDAIVDSLGTHGRFREWNGVGTRTRMELISSLILIVSGANPKCTWSSVMHGTISVDSGSTSLVRGDDTRRRELLEHLNPESEFFSVRYRGIVFIDSTWCHSVEIASRRLPDTTYEYIDTISYYLVARYSRDASSELQEHYSEFRPVEQGVKWPFRKRVLSVGDPSSVTFITALYKFNPVLDDAIFEPSNDTLPPMRLE